jgi:hypothetical protein
MDRPQQQATIILSQSWWQPDTELSFVTRATAGAASRLGPVTVLTPTTPDHTHADGGFEVQGVGYDPTAAWPRSATIEWPQGLPSSGPIVLDHWGEGCDGLTQVVSAHGTPWVVLGPPASRPTTPLPYLPVGDRTEVDALGVFVPVNPIAATHRHNGLGFTGYLLVLGARAGTPAAEPPDPAVAWLTARFPDAYVVAIEHAVATVWKGRSLRGAVAVATRTDLWRLMAHARVTVDLRPGAVIGRECIESLRFGTPVIVPSTSVASAHAQAGGGLTFSTITDLLSGVEALAEDRLRIHLSGIGKDYAERLFGDADRMTRRLEVELFGSG